jgi:hypothetical protein
VFDENTDEGKQMLLSRSSSGKSAFRFIKSCKTKDYEDGHVCLAWEKLKKKYAPVSAPSLFKN